ncbi:DUF6114 domain-containing protein [Micromonospora sp. NPDC049044]|uniref:DUF6114 domain-containing protein n=1 Tax=unclassified Micromonospora TaxID=2617518 RepID=UPI0033FA0DA2
MTTANPSHARPGGLAQAWRLFRRWRRSRPFLGGLFTALAGLEMFASTRMTLNGLSFHSGASGLLSLLIPIILVTCGLLLWITPAQRLFYSIVAAVTAVYSLIGLNLGGFFVGLLLGIVGSALAFAWTPGPPQTDGELAGVEPAGGEQSDAEPTAAGPAGAEQAGDAWSDAEPATVERGVLPAARASDDGGWGVLPTASQTSDDGEPPTRTERPTDPHRAFGVVLVVLGLAAGGLAIQPQGVRAAPIRVASTDCPTPSRDASPSPSDSPAAPTPSPEPDGNVVTDILDGIGDLLDGGRRAQAPEPLPSLAATPIAGPTGTPTDGPGDCSTPAPDGSSPATPGKPGTPTPGQPGTPTPDEPGKVEPGTPLPRIAADPTLPKVAQTPSKLTGSSVRMTGLRFDGVTDLRTERGDLKVLKFSMSEAVTDDFLLSADGPAGRNQRYATDRLTVSGDVAFYATRFVGRLVGIKITLTPDLPLPDGVPITSPIPITFTDPVIDLAYVTSNTLTARPALALTLG